MVRLSQVAGRKWWRRAGQAWETAEPLSQWSRAMPEITHRTIQTNGINMHIAEAGSGPLVVLCHGWPESWYSWRHQLGALAEAR